MVSHAPIVLANRHIEVWLDPANGRLLAVRNVARNLDLITSALDTPPWRLEINGQDAWHTRYTDFAYAFDEAAPEGMAVTLRWDTGLGITLTGRVAVPQDEPTVLLTIAAENAGGPAIDKIEYPYIAGIGPLKPGAVAHLVHAQGTGLLFHNPLATFQPQAGPLQGLRYSPYPEGFSGSSMQFMAYYVEGEGGFYFATRDSGKAMKWLNFFKDAESAALTASFIHQAPHVAPGISFDPGYAVEISALGDGSWYEAAERYRAWAAQQNWTQQGPLAERSERPRWLYEDVGICTFGINAAHDRARWLDEFHRLAGTPVFHILGPNWAPAGQDYANNLPGGSLNDWHPARFSAANLAAMHRNGDRWAPFEFDLLCSHRGDRTEPVLQSRQVLPEHKYSFDRYWFPFMCPATAFWHDLHVERDARMVAEHAPDGVYYDISLNNVLMSCRSPHHGHPPGGGAALADAFARMYHDTKSAMNRTAEHPVALGTEMISELALPFVDYYQARAEASPVSSFEADFWRSWLVQGKVEKIPLFAYVYHEYGPLRMDGWGKLSAEVGDIFYWVASRVTLWGGLFELNYEFSPLEELEGRSDNPDEHYYRFAPRAYGIDPDKAAFVAEVARARTGWANPYLAYGRMERPPVLSAPPITLHYFLYNCGRDVRHYEEQGTITVPSIVCSAWSYRGEKAAILLANLQTETQTVELTLGSPADYGLRAGRPLQLVYRTNDSREALGEARPGRTVTLALPARRIVGLELQEAEG